MASYFRTRTLAKSITSVLFLTVFLFVGVGLYFFFVSGFRYISVSLEAELQLPLTLFLYEVFLLVLSMVIVFSVLVSSLFGLFKSDNNNWLLSSPEYKLFPRIVFIKSVLTSSWPLLVMFLPAVLAFTKIYHLGGVSLFVMMVSVLLLLVLLNACTFLFVVIISEVCRRVASYYKVKSFSLKFLVTILFTALIVLTGLLWVSIKQVDLVKVFKADNADVTVSLSEIGQHFSMSPTHLFAREIVSLQAGDKGTALVYFSLLFALATILTLVWWKFSKWFYPSWQRFQEATSTPVKKGVLGETGGYSFTGSSTMALFKKEILVLSRNMKGLLWFLFLFSIWLAQVGTNVILSKNIQRYQPDIGHAMAMLQALQFIIAIYFICSFALRFVFPSFSVEKKTAWIVGSAPLSFKKIFFGKYAFYSGFFVTLGIIMSYINGNILQVSLAHILYSSVLFVAVIIFIVTFGLTLGALFPSRDTDDPEMISTSMPGLFFTACTLIYGAGSSYVLYMSVLNETVVPLGIFIAVTMGVTITMAGVVPLLAKRSQ